MIHTVKGFGIVSKAEIDVFLKLFCFFYDPANVGSLISGDFEGLYMVTVRASGNVNPSLLRNDCLQCNLLKTSYISKIPNSSLKDLLCKMGHDRAPSAVAFPLAVL